MYKTQQSKGQKRTIVGLIVSILLLTMFTIGMTFAYFTATSSSTSSSMQFGTLEVVIANDPEYGISNSITCGEHALVPGCTVNFTGEVNLGESSVDAFVRLKPTVSITSEWDNEEKDLTKAEAEGELLSLVFGAFERTGDWLRILDSNDQPTGKYLYYVGKFIASGTPSGNAISEYNFANIGGLTAQEVEALNDDASKLANSVYFVFDAEQFGNDWQGCNFTVSLVAQAIQAEHVGISSIEITGANSAEILQSKHALVAQIAGAKAEGAGNEDPTAWAVGFPPVVSFDGNSAIGSIASLTMTGNASIPATADGFTTPSGKQFVGWATSPSGSVINLATYTVTDNVTLFAIWEDIPPYITFSSAEPFTLGVYGVVNSVTNYNKKWTGTLYYSTDLSTWAPWNGSLINSSTDTTKVLYLRGSVNNSIAGLLNDSWVLTGSDIFCSGNIENLLDYQTVANGNHPSMAENCFKFMFYNCTALKKAPELSATTLSNYCYASMFSGCTSLITAPALPATTLATGCYNYMFSGCAALTSAPELPAMNLANSCYQYMFEKCTSLETAPALPAMNLADYCYKNMFNGCTSLETAPALPATALARDCYSHIFHGCTALTVAPALPATTLAIYCYQGMFFNCTSLVSVPELPAVTLVERCYDNMFSGCTSLIVSVTQTGDATHEWRIPSSEVISQSSYTSSQSDMFKNCAGSRSGSNSLAGARGDQYTYYTQNAPVTA